MKKKFKRVNNKGFSLVEVLVAMAVLAVISIPLIQTFVMSSNVNKRAKRLQNATDVGQDVAEYFVAVDKSRLVEQYSINTSLCEEYCIDAGNGITVFKNVGDGNVDENGIPYHEGADGEKFYVTVVMDPAEYSDDTSSLEIKDVNNYLSPELGDLFSVDTVTAYAQIKKYDSRIKKAFKTEYPDDNAIKNIEYDQIKKTLEVIIDQNKNGNTVTYTYSIKVIYTFCDKVGANDLVPKAGYAPIEYNFVIAEGTYEVGDISSKELPKFYLLYTPFDTYDDDHEGLPARDEIIIKYRDGATKAEDWEKPLNLYIVQQDGGKNCSGLSKDNIKLKVYSEIVTSAYTKYHTESLNIFSNIKDWPQNVTAGINSMIKLYEMKVYIWYGEPDSNSVLNYMKSDFVDTSNYTVVSTIKEE